MYTKIYQLTNYHYTINFYQHMVQQPTSHTPDIFMPTIKRKKKRKKGKKWNPKHASLVFISTDTKLKMLTFNHFQVTALLRKTDL